MPGSKMVGGWQCVVCGVRCAWPAMEHGGGKGSSQSKGERGDRQTPWEGA